MMMMESMSYKSSQFSSKPFLLLRCFWKTENGKMERRRRKVVKTEGCRNFCCYLWDQLSASHDDQVHDDAQFLEEESLAEEKKKKSCSQGWWYCQCRMVLPSFQVALCMHHACSSTEREEDDDDDVDEIQHIPNSEKNHFEDACSCSTASSCMKHAWRKICNFRRRRRRWRNWEREIHAVPDTEVIDGLLEAAILLLQLVQALLQLLVLLENQIEVGFVVSFGSRRVDADAGERQTRRRCSCCHCSCSSTSCSSNPPRPLSLSLSLSPLSLDLFLSLSRLLPLFPVATLSLDLSLSLSRLLPLFPDASLCLCLKQSIRTDAEPALHS